MQSKKVLLVNDFKVGGGAEIVMLDHATILKKAGYPVSFLFGKQDIKSYANKFKVLFEYLFNLFFGWIKYFWIIKKEQPVIIHVYNWYHIFSSSFLLSLWLYKKLNKNVKVFYSAHDFHIAVASFPGKDKGIGFRLLRTVPALFFYRLLKLPCMFDKVFAPSRTVASFLEDFYQKLGCSETVAVLFNPLPEALKHELLKSSLSVNDWQQQQNKNNINFLFVGRVSKDKKVLQAAQFLDLTYKDLIKKKKYTNLKFTFSVVGAGNEVEELQKFTKKADIQINLLGKKPQLEVPAIMAKHHVLVLNSRPFVENAPLVMREAAIVNLYMLVVDAEGMKEFADKFGGSYTYPRDNLQTFELQVKNIIENITKGIAPRDKKQVDYIVKLFSPKRFLEILEKYY